MNNLEVIIGIEVHTVLNTKSKMFSSSLSSHHGEPNTHINEVDLGLPGVMPQVNLDAVIKGLYLAKELNMTPNYQNISFDRKNYYYLDLPKGYQITQNDFPIGKDGFLEININDQVKKIYIERIHLEEDTAKQTSHGSKIMLDYNRSGMPLIEIVTKPVISSSLEAQLYLQQLVKILRFNNISDAKLEDGSLRADVNISLRPYGVTWFSPKVEIKNINSISNVKKAIDYEIKRQTELYLSNQPVNQQTRRFDDSNGTTVFMREKTNAVNYRYIHEPNITPIHLSDQEYQKIIDQKPKSLHQIEIDLARDGLEPSMVQQLLNDFEFYKAYHNLNQTVQDGPLCFKWLGIELIGLMKKNQESYGDIKSELLNYLSEMLILLKAQEINGKQAKVILDELYKQPTPVSELIIKHHFQQIKDESVLESILLKHIHANQTMVSGWSERPERVEKFLLGMLMKDTNGQANPVISHDVMIRLLKNLK